MKWVSGTVISYNPETGEGLIAMDGGSEQVRVDLVSPAGGGLITQGQKGPQAENVRAL